MLKKTCIIILVISMVVAFLGCQNENVNSSTNTDKKYTQEDLPKYEQHELELCGLWAPRQMTEEAFLQYKNAGFNVVSFTNHDELPRTSETQYYIGSKRTEEALKLCKKVGLNAYIAYGDSWFNRKNEGDEYFDVAPFSQHDVYGEYKDIIKGIHINDEPHKEEMPPISDQALIDDFEKVYPNAKYMVNIVAVTAGGKHYGYEDYQELYDDYINSIVTKLKNPYISLDFYPFNTLAVQPDRYVASNYNMVAETAKKLGAKKTMIVQSSAGAEFDSVLTEGDMRWQVYSALAFGADHIQYYCYSVPEEIDYNYCMLMPDNKTPSDVYYYVQEINYEIQGMASALLSYEWDKSIGISGSEEMAFRVTELEYDENFEKAKFHDAKYFDSATATHDLIISRFTSDEYGESYMFVNFANREKTNTVKATLKDCGAVAIYGGKGFTGTPKIIELADDGVLTLELQYGEGAFMVPLLK